jgi:Kef-type K+ transport system membrane component KefB
MMAQLLSLGLRRMKQPKVIAEVLGGILLGQYFFLALSLKCLSDVQV